VSEKANNVSEGGAVINREFSATRYGLGYDMAHPIYPIKMVESSQIDDQAQRDQARSQAVQLWGLTDAELAEIQRSLKELTD